MSRARPVLLALALVAAITAAYAPSLRGGFLWDDDLHVTANPVIIGPLGLKEIWTTARANYFPLVLTNFRLQHALWDLNPLGYRIVTLACHALAAVLLWRVLVRLRVPNAWFGAAVWSLHPVQVESVAWICELKNTQSAVFFLLAIWFWLRWLEVERGFSLPLENAHREKDRLKPPSTYYALALACAVLAILSKPSTVMLPVALVLITWWLRRRAGPRDLVPLIPFVALSAIAAGWTIWEQKFHSGASGAEWAQTWPERGAIAGRVIWFYLGKLAWPEPLVFIYPRWQIDAANPFAYLPLVLAIAGLVILWRARDRGAVFRAGFLAAAFFVALLFPVLGFFDVFFFRYSFVGDHFQYLASMGPLAFAGAFAGRVAGVDEIGDERAWSQRGWMAVVLVAAFCLLTAKQSRTYLSKETLWHDTVARNPGSAMAWAQLGSVHASAARHAEAIICFRRALEINPRHPEALNHLGGEYLRAGRVADAIAEFEQALQARPDFAEASSNLGLALVHADRAAEALPHFERALQLRPDAAEPHYNLGRALQALGRAREAIPHYEVALRIAPNRAQTHDDFGLALMAEGRASEAIAEYERALQLQPTLASAHNNLGVAFAQQGRLPEALAHFNEAVRLDPSYAAAHINRGGALAALNQLADAREAFVRAVQLQPDSAKAHAYLAQVLQALGRESDAREHFERAVQLERAAPPAR